MGTLVVVIAWALIRHLLANNDVGPGLTALNLTDPRADLDTPNSSSEQTVSREAIPQESLDRFVETYYSNRPVTDDVVKSLRSFLTTNCHAVPEGSTELLVYFFARIAKDRTDLIRLYESELSEVTGQGAEILLEILRQAGDSRTKGFLESCLVDESYSSIHGSLGKALDLPFPQFQSACLRPVRSGIDLDLLWIEFLVTGSKEPVFRIIDVLNRPDLVRERIQEWLNLPRSRFREWQAFWRIRKLPETFELCFDDGRKQVRPLEDLDCQFGLDGVRTDSKRAEKIRSLLPVGFSAEDLHYIAVKSAAKWSVASNAGKHSIVLEACQEAEAKTLGARLCLLEIQAEAYRLRWQPVDVEKVLDEYLRLNPESLVMARKRADAAAGIISIPRSDSKTVALSDRPGTFV